MKKRNKGNTSINPGITTAINSPRSIIVKPVSSSVCNEGRVFAEALRQTKPLSKVSSSGVSQASFTIREGTALPSGLKIETAKQLVIKARSLNQLVSGANPIGKAAEIVATSDYLDLHAGKDPGITNSPKYVAKNVADIRLSPHQASRKDLVFQFRTERGMIITKANGQVKTGSGKYIASKLVEMAQTPNYGKIGYVDSKFVNQDGSPRVASDAFTSTQARNLQRAKVRLRGIPDLEKRAVKLYKNIIKNDVDGLGPVERRQLIQLRDDIAKAYQYKGVTYRVVGGAAVGAASGAILSLILQIASNEAVDLSTIGETAFIGGLFGAGGSLADASIYHIAANYGLSPEAAKSLAQQSVAVGFCLISITTDIISEAKSVSSGEITKASAISGGSLKVAIDLLPLLFAPLGLVSVPILLVTQVGGRWGIAKIREADKKIEYKVHSSLSKSTKLKEKYDWYHETHQSVKVDHDYTNKMFERAMSLYQQS